MKTGSRVSARRSPWMMRPGRAPMYVRRWPRISASSLTPPRDMRTNRRPRARAMLWPRLVLPTPGGPTKQRIGSRAGLSPVTRSLGAQAAFLDPAAELGHLTVAPHVLPELALNGSELFAQVELALLRREPFLGFRRDLPAQLAHGDLALQQIHQSAELGGERI